MTTTGLWVLISTPSGKSPPEKAIWKAGGDQRSGTFRLIWRLAEDEALNADRLRRAVACILSG